jgi:hypothetical protein
MRSLAERLIAYENSAHESAKAKIPVSFDVTEKLRPHLANLMGKGGFRALLSRALQLAKAEVSWLRAVHVKTDGNLAGFEAIHAQLAPGALLEGRIVLLAQLLGLLVAFIGPAMSLHLVREIWPQISFKDIDFGTEQNDEKAK